MEDSKPNLESKVKVREALPNFDPSSPPSNPQNIRAAKARRLIYSTKRRCYIDEDGYPARDRFG